ncbi:unnamed protein product [Tilletia caries]|nr:unnamed protein product [Tilletia caries]
MEGVELEEERLVPNGHLKAADGREGAPMDRPVEKREVREEGGGGSGSADADAAAAMLSMSAEAGPSRTSMAPPPQPSNPYLKSLAAVGRTSSFQAAGGLVTPSTGMSVDLGGVKLEGVGEMVDDDARKAEESARQLDPSAIHQRFKSALERSQINALMPNYWAPFTSTRDIIDRLLPYHVFDVPEQDLRWALAPPPAERLNEALIRSEGGVAPSYVPPPLSSADTKDESEALVAPAYNYNISMEHLERLAYEEEKTEHARLLGQMKSARAQLDQLHRVFLAAQPPPPKPQPTPQPPARTYQQQYRSPAPQPNSQAGSGSAAPSPAQIKAQQQQAAVNQSQVPSGTINPSIPSTPIPLLIPLTNLTQLLGMNINPAPASHITPAFRKAIVDKPDLQHNPHSLLLAAERVARNARIRRNQVSEGQPDPPPPAVQAELDSLDLLSVLPRVAPPDQAESALLLGISISATAAQSQRFPGPDEFAAPSTVMLHISVVLAKLTASQLSSLAALMQSLQVQAQAQAQSQPQSQPQSQAQSHAVQSTKAPTAAAAAAAPTPRPAPPSAVPYRVQTANTTPVRPSPPVAQGTAPAAAVSQQQAPARVQTSQPPTAQVTAANQQAARPPVQVVNTAQPTTASPAGIRPQVNLTGQGTPGLASDKSIAPAARLAPPPSPSDRSIAPAPAAHPAPPPSASASLNAAVPAPDPVPTSSNA